MMQGRLGNIRDEVGWGIDEVRRGVLMRSGVAGWEVGGWGLRRCGAACNSMLDWPALRRCRGRKVAGEGLWELGEGERWAQRRLMIVEARNARLPCSLLWCRPDGSDS